MDAKALLRQYLEQRRELGESEFMLDSMTVDEALQALGALRTAGSGRRSAGSNAPVSSAAAAPTPAPAQAPSLRAAASEPVGPSAAAPSLKIQPPVASVATAAATPAAPSAPTPSSPAPEAHPDPMAKSFKTGLVVGSADGNLFANNPFAKLKTLDEIAKTVSKCTRCRLYETATNPVPGEGDPKAELVCVGEAPGANEDATGRPFVGAAGQLLTKILAAIDLTREQVFICNVLKHRPPGNRNPRPDEVEACSPYLIRQIELIRPKVIVAFGTFAAQTLLDTKTPIGKLRGAVHRYYGVPLVVTYHPAALLRNPAWKRPTWEDVKLARRVLDHAST